jgi:hypothetical protein
MAEAPARHSFSCGWRSACSATWIHTINFGDILRLDKLVEYRRRMFSQTTNSFLFQKKIAIADYADYFALAVYDRRPADAMLLEQSGDLLPL